MKPWTKILLLAIALVVAAFAKVIIKEVASSMKQNGAVEKLLLEVSAKTNKQLPVMVDEETRCDMTMVAGSKMVYKYTMIHYSSNKEINQKFKKEITKTLVENQCSQENTVKLLNMGVSYNYIYFDKDGLMIASIDIDKSNCN